MSLQRKQRRLAFLAGMFVFVFAIFYCSHVSAANEKIIFLHHSTGEGVYYEGGVPEWIDDYNSDHGTSYQISERNYPDSPYDWENYPYDYWNLWINGSCDSSNPNIECMDTLTQSYDVIIFKHCFPGAAIEEDYGNPDVSSSTKTLENYKVQYRALRDMMDGYPDNVFIVWTLAPLHRLATNTSEAARAKQFVDWVEKEFLTEDGKSHPNFFIFDFWGIVAEDDPNPSNGKANCLKYEYEGSHFGSDSHPNYDANQAAGPEFAETIVDAVEEYFGTSGDGDNETDSDDNDTSGDDDDDNDDYSECAAEQLLGKGAQRLDVLRAFRDKVLAESSAGRKIIAFYYARQEQIADILQKSPLARTSAQKLLKIAVPIIDLIMRVK